MMSTMATIRCRIRRSILPLTTWLFCIRSLAGEAHRNNRWRIPMFQCSNAPSTEGAVMATRLEAFGWILGLGVEGLLLPVVGGRNRCRIILERNPWSQP